MLVWQRALAKGHGRTAEVAVGKKDLPLVPSGACECIVQMSLGVTWSTLNLRSFFEKKLQRMLEDVGKSLKVWEQTGVSGLDGESWWGRRICRVCVWEDFRGVGMWWEVLGIAQMVSGEWGWHEPRAWLAEKGLWKGCVVSWLLGVTAEREAALPQYLQKVDFFWSIYDWGREIFSWLSYFQMHCLISWVRSGVTKALLLHEHEQ